VKEQGTENDGKLCSWAGKGKGRSASKKLAECEVKRAAAKAHRPPKEAAKARRAAGLIASETQKCCLQNGTAGASHC